MAIKIPSYDTPQVQQRAAPTPNVVVNMPNMQESFAKPASVGLSMLDTAVDNANKTRVDEQKYSLMLQSKAVEAQLRQLQGSDAVNPDKVEPIMKEWEAIIKKHEDSLASQGQKEAFKKEAMGIDTGLRVFMGGHMGEQSQKYEQSVNLSGNAIHRENAKELAFNEKAWLRENATAAELFNKAHPGVDTTAALAAQRSKDAKAAYMNLTERGVPSKELKHLLADMDQDDRADAERGGKKNESLALAKAYYVPGMTPVEINKVATRLADGDDTKYKLILSTMKDDAQAHEETVNKQSEDFVYGILTQLRSGKIKPSSATAAINNGPVSQKVKSIGLAQVNAYQEHQTNLAVQQENLAAAKLARITQRPSLEMMYDSKLSTMTDTEFGKFLDGVSQAWYPGLFQARAAALESKGKSQISKTAVDMVISTGVNKDDPSLSNAIGMASAYFAKEMQPGGAFEKKQPDAMVQASRVKFYLQGRATGSLFGGMVSMAEIYQRALAGESTKDLVEDVKNGIDAYKRPLVAALIAATPGKSLNNVEDWFEAMDELEQMSKTSPDRYKSFVQRHAPKIHNPADSGAPTTRIMR